MDDPRLGALIVDSNPDISLIGLLVIKVVLIMVGGQCQRGTS